MSGNLLPPCCLCNSGRLYCYIVLFYGNIFLAGIVLSSVLGLLVSLLVILPGMHSLTSRCVCQSAIVKAASSPMWKTFQAGCAEPGVDELISAGECEFVLSAVVS